MTKLQRLKAELKANEENLLITQYEDEKESIKWNINYLNLLIKKEKKK